MVTERVKKVLLIGGPADGMRAHVDHNATNVWVPIWPELSYGNVTVMPDPGAVVEAPDVEKFEYQITKIAGKRKRFEIFRFRGMSVDDVIEQLISFYGGRGQYG